jgi:hypothetical protein
MVSVALDEEEDMAYERIFAAFIAAGGDPKKFPKPPKKIIAPDTPDPVKRLRDGKSVVVDALKRSKAPFARRKGGIEDYARAKSLKKVFRHSDGTITDEHGVIIEQPEGFAFVPISTASEE